MNAQDLQNRREQVARRQLAVTGGLYFLAWLVFSLALLRHRFMVDGAYMIFEIANEGNYPGAQNRYIIWLLDLFPVLAVRWELPLKTVMISWVVNYTVFYAACFYLVLFAFRNRTAAWLILFMNTLIMAACFFNIADEIVPSATLGVTLAAFWLRAARGKLWKRAVAGLLLALPMFFTVFGHVLVSFSLAMAALYYLAVSDQGERRMALQRFGWPVILFLIFLALRIKFGMDDSYERSNMTLSGASVWAELQTVTGRTVLFFGRFFLTAFPVVIILGAILLIRLAVQRRYTGLATLLVLCAGYLVVWYLTTHSRFGDMEYSVRDHVIVRWMFPLNFLVLFAFLTHRRHPDSPWNRGLLHAVFIAASVFQFGYLYTLSDFADNTLAQYDALQERTSQLPGWKFYGDFGEVCPFGKYHSVYTNSIVFTSIDGPEHTRQIIFAHEDELENIARTPPDSLYIARYVYQPVTYLNPVYFRNDPGPYTRIDFDYRDCAIEE